MDSLDQSTSNYQFRSSKGGRAIPPPRGDWAVILNLFPNATGAEISDPFLTVLVPTLPSKPWPLTVGGLPLQFSTHEAGDSFKKGRLGRGPAVLKELDLHRNIEYDDAVLRKAVDAFQNLQVSIRDIFWYGGFWKVTTTNAADIKQLPFRLANSPVFYQTVAEAPDGDPAALRIKTPKDENFDDSRYVTAPDALLRPGIIVSSSLYTIVRDGKIFEVWDSTTSGILVANTKGEIFITVATHGFGSDGLVWHPDPRTGEVIGNIIESIPHTDISIVKLKAGLRYVSETFGTPNEPEGTRISGITTPHAPHLRIYDTLIMNNPYTGKSEGIVLALGARIVDDATGGELFYIKHERLDFENETSRLKAAVARHSGTRTGKWSGCFDSNKLTDRIASLYRRWSCKGMDTKSAVDYSNSKMLDLHSPSSYRR